MVSLDRKIKNDKFVIFTYHGEFIDININLLYSKKIDKFYEDKKKKIYKIPIYF